MLPTPPPNIDPEKILYVDPKEPPVIDPQKFPEPPSTPVIITEEPKYGELKENPNGTFVYIPNANQPNKPTVDQATFEYTALSGQTVIVRKQFILIQQGDIPSVVQTGYGPLSHNYGWFLLALLPVALVVRFARKGSANA